MIEKERIEAIKRDVDLVTLVKPRGINLKMNGKGYKGRCPSMQTIKARHFQSLRIRTSGNASAATPAAM
jgi:hypothetical protein